MPAKRPRFESAARLALVTDFAQEIVAPRYVWLALYAFGRAAIDDTEYPAALFALRNDDFYGIGSRAEYGTYFRTLRTSLNTLIGNAF